jgi:hypothetical protein
MLISEPISLENLLSLTLKMEMTTLGRDGRISEKHASKLYRQNDSLIGIHSNSTTLHTIRAKTSPISVFEEITSACDKHDRENEFVHKFNNRKKSNPSISRF